MATLQKPNVGKVLEEQNTKLNTVVAEVTAEETKVYDERNDAIETAESTKAQAVLKSRIDKREALNTKDGEIDNLYEQIAELEKQIEGKKQEKKSISKNFNQVAKDAKAAYRTAVKQTKDGAAEKLKELDEKVKAAKGERLSAVFNEVGALVDYRVYQTKVAVMRPINGAIAVGKVLGTAFKNGYNADPGIDVPKSLQKKEPKAPSA